MHVSPRKHGADLLKMLSVQLIAEFTIAMLLLHSLCIQSLNFAQPFKIIRSIRLEN